jgi:hypothetical protein
MQLDVIAKKARRGAKAVASAITRLVEHPVHVDAGSVEGWFDVTAPLPVPRRDVVELEPLFAGAPEDLTAFVTSRDEVIIAVAASRVASEAWVLAASDTENSSVAMRFRDGELHEAEGFGLDGSDLFFEFRHGRWTTEHRSSVGNGFDYSDPYERAVERLTRAAVARKPKRHKQLFDPSDPPRWIGIETDNLAKLGERLVYERAANPDTFHKLGRSLEGLARAAVAEKRFADARKFYRLSAEAAARCLSLLHRDQAADEYLVRANLARVVWHALLAGGADSLEDTRAVLATCRDTPECSFYEQVLDMHDGRLPGAAPHADSGSELLSALISSDEQRFLAAVLDLVATWRSIITSERLRHFPDAVYDELAAGWIRLGQRAWQRQITTPSPFIPQGLVDDGPVSPPTDTERPWTARYLFTPAPGFTERLLLSAPAGVGSTVRAGAWIEFEVRYESGPYVRVPAEEATGTIRYLNEPHPVRLRVEQETATRFRCSPADAVYESPRWPNSISIRGSVEIVAEIDRCGERVQSGPLFFRVE